MTKKKKSKKKEELTEKLAEVTQVESEATQVELEAPKEELKVELKKEESPKKDTACDTLCFGDYKLSSKETFAVREIAKIHQKVKTPWIPYKKLTQEKLDELLKDLSFLNRLGALKVKAVKK